MVKANLALDAKHQATLDGFIVRVPVDTQDRMFATSDGDTSRIDTDDDIPNAQADPKDDFQADWVDLESSDSEIMGSRPAADDDVKLRSYMRGARGSDETMPATRTSGCHHDSSSRHEYATAHIANASDTLLEPDDEGGDGDAAGGSTDAVGGTEADVTDTVYLRRKKRHNAPTMGLVWHRSGDA